MPTDISTGRSDQSVEELRRELAEAREQQAATSEILRVVSSSPMDLKRVFAEIAASAARLCNAYDAAIGQVDGDKLHLVAHYGPIPTTPVVPLIAVALPARAALDRRTIHVRDLQAETDEYPEGSDRARRLGFRTILAVPLMRAGEAIGTISIRRTEARPFTNSQIDLLNTFADQAVIAIENTRLFEELQARTREVELRSAELAESLEYQMAASEVLGVIARAPRNAAPVFRSIVETARRLCNADRATLHFKIPDGRYSPEATSGPALQTLAPQEPVPVDRGSIVGRVVLEGRVVQVDDIQADPEFTYLRTSAVDRRRTMLGVPMLRDGTIIGAISISRSEVKRFTEREIALLETFASQAVIAIENTRLFEEVQARTHELTKSLEYQTATSEVLGVISRSPSQLQPVLDVIVKTARKLCEAENAYVFRLKVGKYHVAAHAQNDVHFLNYLIENPIDPEQQGSVSARAARDRRVIHVPDSFADPEYRLNTSHARAQQRIHGPTSVAAGRTLLSVPLLREGIPIGVITMDRDVVNPFTDRQIDLVTTFADQAVIAIENARLFEEVQARNNELNVALEQQTATSELLKVIGRSAFDLKPVFETLIESAVKLCGATRGFVSRYDGMLLRFEAGYNVTPELTQYFEQNPFAVDRHSNTGRAALERRTVHNIDVQADPEYSYGGKQIDPYRTVLAIPMLKADELLGVLLLYRHEVLPFTDSQIALMETFADQAVIAIENARLFQEVEARNRDLTALGEVGRAVSSSLERKVVLPRILEYACALSDTGGGAIYVFDKVRRQFDLEAGLNMSEELIAQVREHPIQIGESLVGQCAERREAVQFDDLNQAPPHPLIDMHMKAGVRALLAVPLLHQDEVVGALVVRRTRAGAFAAETIALLQSFASQSAIAIQNARLFDEIAQKSRELEIASQHKSQFVANMSHELRTPLAAILGYAELMQEGFYEPQGPKSQDALTRIRSNGKHLLGLINTVLDIAKIESGQFNLNLGEYALENVVETVRSATEALAETKTLALKTDVAKSLPIGFGDEQRLTQVLLNLVGNAIKFTDAGEVRISAAVANEHFTVSVMDTGPGIAEEHQLRIFEQFHQIDSSNTKAKGGTGLGLAIAKQIVEMHGGRIWVESTLGKGATFQMELPIHAENRKAMA